jgi:hypothetical protein
MSYFTRIESTWCQIQGLRRRSSLQFMIHLQQAIRGFSKPTDKSERGSHGRASNRML